MLSILGQLQKNSGVVPVMVSVHCLFPNSLCIKMFNYSRDILIFKVELRKGHDRSLECY